MEAAPFFCFENGVIPHIVKGLAITKKYTPKSPCLTQGSQEKIMKFRSIIRLAGAAAFTALLLSISYDAPAREASVPADEKDTVQFVLKHLDSIGTKETREKIKSMTIAGTAKAVFKGRGSGETSGLVVLASQGKSNLIGMKFATPDYPHERMGYDGKDFSVAFVTPGIRSPLGDFMRTNDKTFEVGILGGVLSTGWELLKYDAKRGKLECDDPKGADGAQTRECSYRPKKGSDLRIKLFFDESTGRHLKTEYNRVISARQGQSVDQSARQVETRYQMIEEFGNFREENGLTLPHTYILYLEIQTGAGSWIYRWDMDLQQFQVNNDIDPKEFKVDTY